MKPIHTTNYANAFIEVAEDCRAEAGMVPPGKAVPTVARMQYDRLIANPYKYTSDDLIFEIHAERNGIKKAEREKGRADWGIHFDAQSRVAIYPLGSKEYARFQADKALKHLKAMRSAKAGKAARA